METRDMTQVNRLLTLLNEGYGKLTRDELLKKVEQAPLKKIPPPPQAYLDLKGALKDFEGDQKNYARSGFYKKNEYAREEIGKYMVELSRIRDWNYENSMVPNMAFIGVGMFPVEKVAGDWMMLYDFDCNREGDLVKVFIPLNMEYWSIIDEPKTDWRD